MNHTNQGKAMAKECYNSYTIVFRYNLLCKKEVSKIYKGQKIFLLCNRRIYYTLLPLLPPGFLVVS
jgi:hypothetical protein